MLIKHKLVIRQVITNFKIKEANGSKINSKRLLNLWLIQLDKEKKSIEIIF